MFKLNLKIAIRNLLKNKTYAAINILGLSLGMTAFVLLLLYVNNQESYDTWSDELESVYKVREYHDFFTPDNKPHWQDSNESRIAALLREKVPQVQEATKVDQIWGEGFSAKVGNQDPVMIKHMRDADSSFFKVFPYAFLRGDRATALSKPNTVVLKKRAAIQLFGSDDVIGKTFKLVRWMTDKGNDLTVTGVIDDVETPESLDFQAITHTGNKDTDPQELSNMNFCLVYVKVKSADTALASKNIQAAYLDHKKMLLKARQIEYSDFLKTGNKAALMLMPIAEVHGNPPFAVGWFEKIKPVMAIAAFLFLVSIINFINLATAQSVQRAKEVGVRKVLGSYRVQLFRQFIMEAGLQSLLALFICVALVELVLPAFNTNFNVTLAFWHNPVLPGLLLQLLGIFMLVTLFAGFYPAWVISKYDPVAVLKGNFNGSLKGIMLRNVLVVFQFVISVTFIISIGIMHMQSTFMASKDLGFDKSRLVNIATNYEDNFVERIRRVPGVKYVGTTTQVIGNAFNVPEELNYKGKKHNVNTVTVTMESLPALGVKVVSGRIFDSKFAQDTVNTIVLNESAAKLMDRNMVGKSVHIIGYQSKRFDFQVVGVIKDYHAEGFDKEVLPTMYKVTSLGGTSSTDNLLVKLENERSSGTMQGIEKEWKALYPNFPMTWRYVDEAFKASLEDNERFVSMVMLFSLVSITLSLLGLFALSTFLAKRRTREIAVRKVLGASDLQIVNLLNRNFLILVGIANLVSWPIAYMITRKWLDGFVYRIDMPWLPFFGATLISIIIAILTVSIQAKKAVNANPVNALKYE